LSRLVFALILFTFLVALTGCPGGGATPSDAGQDLVDSGDGGVRDADGVGPGDEAGPECLLDGDCNDGDPCNGDEACQAGDCFPGTPPSCDDNNPCTLDACVARVGCRNEPTAGA